MSDTLRPKIFCFILAAHMSVWGVISIALAEDGHVLTTHSSSTAEWAQHDMGITSDWKHDIYAEHYPAGYDLKWIEGPPADDPDVASAYSKYTFDAREQEHIPLAIDELIRKTFNKDQ